MLVLFGSQTGNAQDVAERIVWRARLDHRWDACCLPMDTVSLEQLPSHQVAVYVCSTTGMYFSFVWSNFRTNHCTSVSEERIAIGWLATIA
jgi:sulfite reductase alpha subunit-like flavoprotein